MTTNIDTENYLCSLTKKEKKQRIAIAGAILTNILQAYIEADSGSTAAVVAYTYADYFMKQTKQEKEEVKSAKANKKKSKEKLLAWAIQNGSDKLKLMAAASGKGISRLARREFIDMHTPIGFIYYDWEKKIRALMPKDTKNSIELEEIKQLKEIQEKNLEIYPHIDMDRMLVYKDGTKDEIEEYVLSIAIRTPDEELFWKSKVMDS